MLFYFSATGNSRWVAESIARSIGDRTVAIAEAMRGDCTFTLADNERIGFCFPVHGWQPPRIVADFIARLRINAGRSYCYVVVTAGDNVGRTLQIAELMLSGKGIKMESAFSLIMPEAYVGLRLLHLDTAERARQKVRAASKQIEHIADTVLDRRGGWYGVVEGKWPRINSTVLGWAFKKWLVSDKAFRVDSEKCIGCGLCEQKCPVGNVRLDKDKRPEWLHTGQCLTCFACYHYCPQRAIDFGGQTRGVGQYHFDKSLLG